MNELVILAKSAMVAGERSVLVLDLNSHCGGATASLIEDEPRIWQVDVSVSSFDRNASPERARLALDKKSSEYLFASEGMLSAMGSRIVMILIPAYTTRVWIRLRIAQPVG